jgi:two-component system NtrC family sensor kinase
MRSGNHRVLQDWLLAALVGGVAVIVRAVAQPVMGDELPFVVALPATVLAALMWGTWPGLLTAGICAVAVASPVIPPDLPPMARPFQVGAFAVSSLFIALLCGQLRRPRVLATGVHAGELGETPLTSWLRAVLWGAFLVPATAFVFTAWWGFERAQRDAEATVAHASDLIHAQALRTFAIAAEIAHRADAASQGVDENVRAREMAVHQRLADMVAGLPSVVNLNVWDAEGRPLARSDLYPVDARASVADRSYFLDQKKQSLPLGISEVVKGRQTGRELTNATVRRSSPDGSFEGIVAVSLAPSFFSDFYQTLASEEPNLATFALIRTDGTILARWPLLTDGRSRVPDDSPILKRVRDGERSGSVTLTASADGSARLASFKRVEPYPLYVVAGVSREAMLANWVRFVALLAAVLVPTTAGLVYVSWVALTKTRREQATSVELAEQIRLRANAERSMIESQKLETLAAVTGGVAHDFNNLLAIVNASLHVLKRLHPELAGEKQVQAMSRAVQSGVRLTRQLLSFARKQALRPETVKLQDWLPAVEALARSTLGASIGWSASVEPDTRPVHVDLGELELAFINLVVNANHAMPRGGTLQVRVHNGRDASNNGADRVVLAVQDSGVGIPPELLPKVCEPFFTTRERGSGSGLGLSQVQGFCVNSGGHVHIDSVVGQGTTVSIYLPAAAVPTAESLLPEPAVPERLHGRMLLVEDNHDVASTTELMLRTVGLEVVRAANVEEALAVLEAQVDSLQVVLSDIAMPGAMNGIAFAFEVRKRYPALPVLLTTGYADQIEAAAAGGFRVLPKPIALDELLGELQAVLSAADLTARTA